MPEKIFNITGPCVPSLHYMVDTGSKIQEIIKGYIDQGFYFTINRARQFGKTTTLGLLARELEKDFIVIPISFEGFGADVFTEEKTFIATFMRRCLQRIPQYLRNEPFAKLWSDSESVSNLAELGDRIVEIAASTTRRMVLMIDEVDKSSNARLFLDFLGVLRDKYIDRSLYAAPTFYSVILVGVHDIKNLKLKLRADEKAVPNSPWNIAAAFNVDMSFSPEEIATMLKEYEADHHTGMDIHSVSDSIYHYTEGYPFFGKQYL